VLIELGKWNVSDEAAQGALAADYASLCITVGQHVQAIMPSSEPVQGLAVGIAESGALLISAGTQTLEVSAGDIVHIRPGDVTG
jgi:BirA family biotin operon repressor/biotin-[acetyl-CoA-carboxylase] ligase